jgi:hypothetical protein
MWTIRVVININNSNEAKKNNISVKFELLLLCLPSSLHLFLLKLSVFVMGQLT